MSFRSVRDNSISSNKTLSAVAPTDGKVWVRNPSWLPLPSVTESDQKIVLLCSIRAPSQFAAINLNGAGGTLQHTIDWGDGTVETVSAYGTYYHTYDYNNSALDGSNAPVTFTDAGDLVTRTAHGYTDGMTIRFASITGTTGISAYTPYYVVNSTTDTFQVSASLNGSPIALTTNGSGFILDYKQAVVTITTGCLYFNTLNITVKHNQSGLVNGYVSGWLELIAAGDFTTLNLKSSSSTVRNDYIEHISILKSNVNTFDSQFSDLVRLEKVSSLKSNSTVTSTRLCFSNCTSLKEVPEIDTSAVTDASSMFNSCTQLQQVKKLDLPVCTTIGTIFNNCYSLINVNISTSASLTNSSSAFSSCYSLEEFPYFETKNVTDVSSMFNTCRSLTKIPEYDFSSVTTATNLFSNCTSLNSIKLDFPSLTNPTNMFSSCSSLDNAYVNIPSATTTNNMFTSCISLKSPTVITSSSLTVTSFMFSTCSSLKSVDWFETSGVTDFSFMFNNCMYLEDVPAFNTSSATNVRNMFGNCNNLERVPLLNTANVTNMSGMFYNCYNIKTIPNLITTSVVGSTTSTGFATMFNACRSLEYVPALTMSGITLTGGVTSLFSGCSSLKRIDITGLSKTFTVASCMLSGAELDNIYTNLPTVTGQTLTVTGNYGTTSDTPTIATAKGWTITGS